MREALERADTRAPEVTIDGENRGNRRVAPATYSTVFGEVEVERSAYQRSGRGRVAVPLELRLGIVEGAYIPPRRTVVGAQAESWSCRACA